MGEITEIALSNHVVFDVIRIFHGLPLNNVKVLMRCELARELLGLIQTD
jgi:hypothetical protein